MCHTRIIMGCICKCKPKNSMHGISIVSCICTQFIFKDGMLMPFSNRFYITNTFKWRSSFVKHTFKTPVSGCCSLSHWGLQGGPLTEKRLEDENTDLKSESSSRRKIPLLSRPASALFQTMARMADAAKDSAVRCFNFNLVIKSY